MKKIIITVSYTLLITLCINAQTNKDSISPKPDTILRTPNTTVPEYQNYPFNPASTEPNASPGVTLPSINSTGITLPYNTPGDITAPATQIAPDTSELQYSKPALSPGTTAPDLQDGRNMSPANTALPLPDNGDMSPVPANPALPATPGIQDNQTPMPE